MEEELKKELISILREDLNLQEDCYFSMPKYLDKLFKRLNEKAGPNIDIGKTFWPSCGTSRIFHELLTQNFSFNNADTQLIYEACNGVLIPERATPLVAHESLSNIADILSLEEAHAKKNKDNAQYSFFFARDLLKTIMQTPDDIVDAVIASLGDPMTLPVDATESPSEEDSIKKLLEDQWNQLKGTLRTLMKVMPKEDSSSAMKTMHNDDDKEDSSASESSALLSPDEPVPWVNRLQIQNEDSASKYSDKFNAVLKDLGIPILSITLDTTELPPDKIISRSRAEQDNNLADMHERQCNQLIDTIYNILYTDRVKTDEEGADDEFEAQEHVYILWDDGRWYPRQIMEVNRDGTSTPVSYNVKWYDGVKQNIKSIEIRKSTNMDFFRRTQISKLWHKALETDNIAQVGVLKKLIPCTVGVPTKKLRIACQHDAVECWKALAANAVTRGDLSLSRYKAHRQWYKDMITCNALKIAKNLLPSLDKKLVENSGWAGIESVASPEMVGILASHGVKFNLSYTLQHGFTYREWDESAKPKKFVMYDEHTFVFTGKVVDQILRRHCIIHASCACSPQSPCPITKRFQTIMKAIKKAGANIQVLLDEEPVKLMAHLIGIRLFPDVFDKWSAEPRTSLYDLIQEGTRPNCVYGLTKEKVQGRATTFLDTLAFLREHESWPTHENDDTVESL